MAPGDEPLHQRWSEKTRCSEDQDTHSSIVT
jgi:hypothetical protein